MTATGRTKKLIILTDSGHQIPVDNEQSDLHQLSGMQKLQATTKNLLSLSVQFSDMKGGLVSTYDHFIDMMHLSSIVQMHYG